MTIDLELDLDAGVVTLSKGGSTISLRNKWVELYAILYLKYPPAGGDGRYLVPQELATVGRWAHNKEKNRGKTIARHLKRLESKGLGAALDVQGKTIGWRLNRGSIAIKAAPSSSQLANWLENCGWGAPARRPEVGMLKFAAWVESGVESLILLQEGRVEESFEWATITWKRSAHGMHRRVATLLKMRAIQRIGEDEENEFGISEEEESEGYWGVDRIGQALFARSVAFSKYWTRVDDASQEAAHIQTILSRAQNGADAGGIGILENTYAVLMRRNGRYSDAVRSLMQGIPLLIANGDLITLQSALFNIGLCWGLVQKSNGIAIDKHATSFLELDRKMRKRLNVGKDTAQCEIVLALAAIEKCEFEVVEKYMEEIEEMLSNNHSDYDEGCYHRVKARYLVRRAKYHDRLGDDVRSQALHELRAAKHYFEKCE